MAYSALQTDTAARRQARDDRGGIFGPCSLRCRAKTSGTTRRRAMTQITGFIAPQRRAGELGVHSVDGFNITVPNLTCASAFYAAFGVKVCNEQNGFGLYTDGHGHRWGGVSEGAAKKLSYISFGAFEDDFERLRARLPENGVKHLDAPAGFESNG